MEMFIKEFPDCLMQVFVKIGKIEINDEFDKALRDMQKDFSYAGYRPGKVPVEIIEKNASPEQINRVIVNNVVYKVTNEVRAKGIEFFSDPKFKPLSGLSRQETFAFYLVFETAPKIISDLDLDKIALDYEEFVVDDKSISAMMKRNLSSLEPVSGAAESEDSVTTNILNPEYIDETKSYVFDSGKVPALVGKKKGEKIDLSFADLTEGYIVDFLGKIKEPLKVEITLIERSKPAEPTAEIVKEMTGKESVDDYKKEVTTYLNDFAEKMNFYQKRAVFSKYMKEKMQLELPRSIYLDQVDHATHHFLEDNLMISELKLDDILKDEKFKTDYMKIFDDVREELVLFYTLKEIASKYNIQPTPEQVNYIAYKMARDAGLTLDELKRKATKEDWERFESQAQSDAALAFAMNKVKFTGKNKKSVYGDESKEKGAKKK